MALYLCKNSDGTGVVNDLNAIETKHTSGGEPVTLALYLFNDGKRFGVENDKVQNLIYTDIQIKVEGVAYELQTSLSASKTDVTVYLDSVDGWNIGTIIKSGTERMRVEELLTAKSVRVQRDYTADGKPSTIQSHNINAIFISECDSVSLALPSVGDYNNPATFLGGGLPLKGGLDPSNLAVTVDALETSNIIRSNNGSLYHVNSIIKIDEELMKVTSKSGNDLTVLRGYNGSVKTSHSLNAVITCVGIVDIKPVTHKFFIKNDPPSGLPTQKKRDIKIVVQGSEEAL